MFIKSIEVQNFRSFSELSIKPSNFNVLIGPNASGKTNFLQMFRFLRDIVKLGLENAVSMQGGIEYLQNVQINKNNDTTFDIQTVYNKSAKYQKQIKGKMLAITPLECQLKFSIHYDSTADDYSIISDHLIQSLLFEIDNEFCNEGTLEFHKTISDSNHIKFHNALNIKNFEQSPIDLQIEDIVSLPFAVTPITDSFNPATSENIASAGSKHLFIEHEYYMPYPRNLHSVLKNIPIYDLDLLKDNADSSIVGRTKLEDNGDNIAIVLKKLLNNPSQKREFFNYVQHVLPFIEDIEVERILDKHLQIKYRETYTTNAYMPASLMSSGTITLLAIIVGIFFEKNKIIVFEEPGGRIHPYLISRIINMMQNMHDETQIFLTTHNPEIVKYAGIDNVFCLSRNSSGASTIDHLSQKKDIMQFLENEIGLDELFVQNLLSK